jgi:hypothetical protein
MLQAPELSHDEQTGFSRWGHVFTAVMPSKAAQGL